MNRKILAVTHDPGGALALAPVLKKLNEIDGIDLSVYAGKWAQRVLTKSGLEFMGIETDLKPERGRDLVERERPALLLSGTSWGSDVEQMMRNEVLLRNIPSMVVLDFWSNYGLRFKNAAYPLSSMKDTVCVMDERTKKEMVDEGFSADAIAVTGHPHLEYIFRDGTGKPSISGSATGVLFLSQPDIRNAKQGLNGAFYRILTDGIKGIALRNGRKISLTIKPHPKEVFTEEMCDTLSELATEMLDVEIERPESDLGKLLTAAHIVVGYPTMALFESMAAGKITYGITAEDTNPALKTALEGAGVKLIALNKNGILIQGADEFLNPPLFHDGAALRVLKLIRDRLK